MSNHDTRYPKGYYKDHPKELPSSLKGFDFHAVTKTRLPGNSNRTTIFEFLPKQFKALLDGVEKTIEKAVSDATKKLKKKQRALKSELKQASEALASVEQELDETIAERDEALAKVKQLTRKPSKASEDPKKIKYLERELERIKRLFEQKNDENKKLKSQFQIDYGDAQKARTDLIVAQAHNLKLATFLSDINAALEKRGIELEDLMPETSGMISASTILSSSTTKVTTPKPYRG
ncbi:hypothetical protein [Pseudomonas fulva]|nr:hypothetical protein [Pseudomonas fulva]